LRCFLGQLAVDATLLVSSTNVPRGSPGIVNHGLVCVKPSARHAFDAHSGDLNRADASRNAGKISRAVSLAPNSRRSLFAIQRS
jgi:hypothetical protein